MSNEPHVIKQIEHALADNPQGISREMADYIRGCISDYRNAQSQPAATTEREATKPSTAELIEWAKADSCRHKPGTVGYNVAAATIAALERLQRYESSDAYRDAMKQAERADGMDTQKFIAVLVKHVANQQRELARLKGAKP